jgi:hypothetical protein
VAIMEWPAQSPHLNPIERFWEQLDRMVRKKCPSSQSNLWEMLQEAWGEISSDYLNKLTTRMPTHFIYAFMENKVISKWPQTFER